MIERIKKLEKSNKILKKYLLSLHIILVGMIIVGFQSSGVSDLIETKKLVIKDDNGEDRITLSTNEGASSIRMSNDSYTQVELYSSDFTNFLHLQFPNTGSLRLYNEYLGSSLVSLRDDENKNFPIMSSNVGFEGGSGSYGKFTLGLYNGGSRLAFFQDQSFKKQLSLSSNKESTNISLFDTNGNRRVSIGNQDMIDQYGNDYKTSVSNIHLFDKNYKSIYSAPR